MPDADVLTVEHRGVEPVPDDQRRGRPASLITLWCGANVEFATLVTGVLATAAFGLSFWQAFAAIVVGNLLGAGLLGVLSTFGPRLGLPQLIQSRRSFGYVGNFVPGLFNFVAGFSWFAVNTVLGVFALEELLGIDFAGGLAIMVVVQVLIAVIGHHLIHAVERYLAGLLTAVFIAVSVYAFGHGHTAAPFHAKVAADVGGFSGAFILTVSICFSYVLGWMPYASDYTRYLPRFTPAWRVFAYVSASMLVSGVWLEALGAAFGTADNALSQPAQLVHGLLPHALGQITMVAVALGTITANVLNIYSGALSSLVLGIPLKRWMAALVVGGCGTVLSWFAGQHNYYQHYENFLFLLGYWIAPWVAVVAIDLGVRRLNGGGRASVDRFYDRRARAGRGLVAWLVGVAASVPFMNQTIWHGPVATGHPGLGDITYYVGFVVAAVVYGLLAWRAPPGALPTGATAGAVPNRA